MAKKQIFNTSAELNYPSILPTLDLDFANSKTLDPRITFRRASGGSYVGPDGRLRLAGVNEPRFTHDPVTGECLGLLVEEPRANWIRNNTMVGAVAGTPGTAPTNWTVLSLASGLTREVVGTGAENGITYVDVRYSGTPSSTGALIFRPEAIGIASALSGQSWTFSSWVKVVAGSFSNLNTPQINLTEWTAGGVFVAESLISIGSITSSLTRVTGTRTLTGGTTASVTGDIRFYVTASGTPIDFTLRIGLPQLEQGAFATSAIPTTGSTATRSADVAVITGAAFSSWYRQDAGSVFVSSGLLANVNTYEASFTDNTNNNHHYLRYIATQHQVVSSAGGTPNTNIFSDGGGSILSTRTAYSYGNNSYSVSSNGLLGDFSTTSGGIPSTVDRLNIGFSQVSGAPGNLSIRRLTFWPTRLPNSTLQAITL